MALCAAAANAHTYYVSDSGRNAGPGTLTQPFRTVDKAASIARPGDSVLVRAGVYYGYQTITCRGRSSAHIVFRPFPGEKVVFDGAGTPKQTNVVTIQDSAYVDFSGFEIRNAAHIGICLWGVKSVRITGNQVHDTWRNGIYSGGDVPGYNSDVVIQGNDVHDAALENSRHNLDFGGWSSGISVTYTNRALVTGNRSHHNQGEGIQVGLARDVTIEQNNVFDNYSSNIYIDSSRSVRVNRNMVYNTGDRSVFRFDVPAAGIAAAHESWAGHNTLSDIAVTNNIVVNTRWGFYYGAYEAGGGLKNTTIANNTFYKAAESLLRIDKDRHANSVVQNNIFDQPGGAHAAEVAGAGITYRNNDWYGASPGAAAGPGDVRADPRLANPGGLRALDYMLTAGSPIVQKGAPVALVTSDYFGSPRVGGYDIGAHQLTGASSRTVVRRRVRADVAPDLVAALPSQSEPAQRELAHDSER